MGLGKSVEGITLFLDEDCQIILVDLFFRIIIIFPDKAAIFPVLCNRRVADNFPVFISRIKIKDKNATGGRDNCSPGGTPVAVPLPPEYNSQSHIH